MDLDKLLPLLAIWVIWKIVKRMKRTGRQTGQPASIKQERESGPFNLEVLPDEQTIEVEPAEAPPALLFSETENTLSVQEVSSLREKSFMPKRHKICRIYNKSSLHFLKTVVIWSEILAAPKALRDD